MKFSVLMSVYIKETPKFLDRALESLCFQTKKANEVILVEDGPLTDELYEVIEKWRDKLNIKSIKLEKNIGLGLALQGGLKNCSFDIIARMDSDDICLENRFEDQINYLDNNPNIDIIGGYISEFDKDENIITGLREVPLAYSAVAKFAKKRNAMNHVTVMFKKEAVMKVEGYKSFLGFEDYYLWARMLNMNAKFANIPKILVNVRGGNAMVARRQGLKYAKIEYQLQKKLYEIKFLTIGDFIRNIFQRIPVRLCPGFIIKIIYKYFLRSSKLEARSSRRSSFNNNPFV